jgi:hypothetical protein
MKRILLALAAASLLGGCGALGGKGKKNVTPTVGERISVLSQERVLEVDPALAGTAVTLPPAQPNAEWAQSGGNAAKSMGHVGLAAAPALGWRVSIGQGSGSQGQLASSPVLGEGRIFTIDTRDVRGVRRHHGAPCGQTQVARRRRAERRLFAGVSFDNGRSTPPTVPASPSRSMPASVDPSGRSARAARCAAPPPSPTRMSMW